MAVRLSRLGLIERIAFLDEGTGESRASQRRTGRDLAV
jgi:hypothetical protein